MMDCDISPCENNGSCAILAGSYICTCPFNYNGVNCQNPGMSIHAWFGDDSAVKFTSARLDLYNYAR